MRLDYFGTDEDIAALEAQLPAVQGPARPALLASLAWYLRQRDTLRALGFADAAQALLAGPDADIDADEAARIEARLTLVRGEAEWVFGNLETAADIVESARQRFEAVDDFTGVGDACLHLMRPAFMGTRPVVVSLTAASQAYERAGDRLRADIAHAVRVVAAFDRDRHKALEDAVGLDATASWNCAGLNAFVALFHASHIYWRCEYVQSVAPYQRALDLFTEAGQLYWAFTAACNLCGALTEVGDNARGLGVLDRALAQARPTGWPLPSARILSNMADVLDRMGQHDDAWRLLEEARPLLAGMQSSTTWAMVCAFSGRVQLNRGQAEDALRWYALGRSVGVPNIIGVCSLGQARALARLGRVAEAIPLLEAALATSYQKGHRGLTSRVLHAHAEIAREHGLLKPPGSTAPSAAIHYLEAALAEAAMMEGHAQPHEWLSELSREYEAAGQLARALECERRATAAREVTRSKQATDLAASMHARYETERARAEAAHQRALVQAEAARADAEAAANRAKSSFLANMSHELRSPLNAMLGFSRLLLRHPGLDERARHDAAIVLNSGEHLYTLINQVLELSKVEAGRLSVQRVALDVDVLLEELEEMFSLGARQKGLRLAVEAAPDVPRHVEADAVKLRQVLVNLLSNAIKFTEQGGVTLQVRLEGGRLAFEVDDTGVGIGQHELAQLGEAFVQAEAGRAAAEGTGLGLAISRNFVRLMGGELRLTSRPGVGTSASFGIPVQIIEGATTAPTATPAQAIIGLEPGCGRPRILAVDDWPQSRQLVVRLLEPLGFEVREAADGQEAVQQWHQWSPHLILMDMRMPVMDGREATRRIKAAPGGRETVIVALTASSFEEQREEILAAGCDDFMRKPFQEDALLEMLARHLKLQYTYDDVPHRAPAPPTPPDAARLAALPSLVRERLRAALRGLDVQAIEEALDAVRMHDHTVADALTPLAREFQYERMRALLS